MKIQVLIAVLATLLLSACAETQFGAHLAKQVYDDPSEGQYKVGNPYLIDGQEYYPQESFDYSETGIASWYGPGFHGKKTANGEVFDKHELTAAHRTLQMPSLARVTNLDNGRSLVVRVNDRGPFKKGRIIDVSQKAAELLCFKGNGTAKVRVEVLGEESRKMAELARQGRDTRGMEVALNQRQTPILAAPSTPVSAESLPPVQVAAVESQPLPPVAGHYSKQGNFLPDPVVTQRPIVKTNIYVQAGAFGKEENAVRLSQKLSSIGNSHVYRADVGGQRFYRVRLGPFATVDEADRALSLVLAKDTPKAMIVVD